MDNLVFFLILVERLSVFHHWEWCSPWLRHMGVLLWCIRIHICPLPGAFLSEMSVGYCQKLFSACIERLIQCSFFSLLMWCVILICGYWRLLDISHSVMPYNPWNVCGCSLSLFCWGFLHLWLSVIVNCNCLLCGTLFWFGYQGDGGLIECPWDYSFLFFGKSFRRVGIIASLNIWENLPV